MTSKNSRRRYIRWRMGGVMRENRKVVQTGEDSVNFYCCSWFLTFDRPFLKRLYKLPVRKVGHAQVAYVFAANR